jgi:hypothetical protein
MFYGMDSYKSIAAMQKIFVLWMKDRISFVTVENLLREINENQVTALATIPI